MPAIALLRTHQAKMEACGLVKSALGRNWFYQITGLWQGERQLHINYMPAYGRDGYQVGWSVNQFRQGEESWYRWEDVRRRLAR